MVEENSLSILYKVHLTRIKPIILLEKDRKGRCNFIEVNKDTKPSAEVLQISTSCGNTCDSPSLSLSLYILAPNNIYQRRMKYTINSTRVNIIGTEKVDKFH